MKKVLGMFIVLVLSAAAVSAATVTVTNPPPGGVTWVKGTTYTITWIKSGTMPNTVRLSLRDPITLAERKLIQDNVSNTGTWPWTIPADIVDGQYRLRVKVKDVAVQDDSDVFTISAVAPPAASIDVTKPTTGDKWHRNTAYTITWTKTGTMPDKVKISLMDKNSATVKKEIADGVDNTGSCPWTIPADMAFDDYRVRVLVKTTNIKDDSQTFSIAAMSITQGSPVVVEKKKTITIPAQTWKQSEIKGQYQNWGGYLPYTAQYDQPPESAYIGYAVGYPPNTSGTAYAHVGYDYHSFQWEMGDIGWLAVVCRSKVTFLIDQFQGKSAQLISATMRLKQVSVQRLNDGHTSCGTGFFIFTAPWTNFYNPPITAGPNTGLNFGSADYTIDITSIVKSWLDGTQTNYGLLLMSQEITFGQQPKICGSAFDVTLILKFKND